MKTGLKKYRLTTLSLMVVLAINLAVPAAVQAASFYCTAQTDATVGTSTGDTATGCCGGNTVDDISETADVQDNLNSCTSTQICEEVVSNPLSSVKSLLSLKNQVQSLSAETEAFYSLPLPDIRSEGNEKFVLENSTHPSPAPIFILTSTFLN